MKMSIGQNVFVISADRRTVEIVLECGPGWIRTGSGTYGFQRRNWEIDPKHGGGWVVQEKERISGPGAQGVMGVPCGK